MSEKERERERERERQRDREGRLIGEEWWGKGGREEAQTPLSGYKTRSWGCEWRHRKGKMRQIGNYGVGTASMKIDFAVRGQLSALHEARILEREH